MMKKYRIRILPMLRLRQKFEKVILLRESASAVVMSKTCDVPENVTIKLVNASIQIINNEIHFTS